METIRIECAYPWIRPEIYSDAEVVNVLVGRGSGMREYKVHADLLVAASSSFEDLLDEAVKISRTQLDDDNDYSTPQIKLPDENPAVFDALHKYIYNGFIIQPNLSTLPSSDIARPNSNPPPLSDMLVCQIYFFADERRIDGLRNETLSYFYAKLLHTVWTGNKLPYDVINYIHENSRKNDCLWFLIIDVMVNIGNFFDVEDWKDKLPVQFFVDLLNRARLDGVVPFSFTDSATRWLDSGRADVCARYHDHRLEEDSENTDESGDDVEMEDEDASEEEIENGHEGDEDDMENDQENEEELSDPDDLWG